MTLPKTAIAYADCYELMEQALDHPRGTRVPMPSWDSATFYRMRMNQARVVQREDNKKMYTEDHILYGASVFDRLAFRIREHDDQVWIYIEPYQSLTASAEPITEEMLALPSPVRAALPAPKGEMTILPPLTSIKRRA